MVGVSKLFKSTRGVIATALNKISSVNIMSASGSSSNNKAVLIFLHGLGDQGSSWHMQLSPMIPSHIKCVCPTAPNQAVTLNFGMKTNSWFDLRSLDPNDPEDEVGIEAARERIHKLIDEHEKNGIPHDRIMLGGFSQGGALSLYSAFTYHKKLAGVIALSCWLPLHGKFPSKASEANRNVPVLQCHGDQDFVVPYAWSQASEKVISTFVDKSKYQFKTYKGLGHSSSGAELHDVLEFIGKNLPKTS